MMGDLPDLPCSALSPVLVILGQGAGAGGRGLFSCIPASA